MNNRSNNEDERTMMFMDNDDTQRTSYDGERTRPSDKTDSPDSEETEFVNTESHRSYVSDNDVEDVAVQRSQALNNERKEGGSTWKKVAIGSGVGILLGASSAIASEYILNRDKHDTDESDVSDEEDETDNNSAESDDVVVDGDLPAWSDGEVDIAETVNDDMSFSEAFSAARAELGAGAVFEWRGNVYSTYYAEEWEQMSDEERDEFNNHFSWSNASSSSSTDVVEDEQDDELMEVELSGEDVILSSDAQNVESEDVLAETVSEEAYEAEIEVLGVEYDEETGYSYAALSIDDQEVVVVDVDSDYDVDYVVADFDENGYITEDEVVDVTTQTSDDQSYLCASDDGYPDYVNDDYDAYDMA
jgi:hypothetical protein